MNKKDFLFLLHQYRGQDYVDIYPFNADNRKIESYFQEILEKVEEQHKSHTQLESKINKTIEDHIRNSSKHITESERSAWNAKETPSAAQAKAKKALEDAKTYTDQQIEAIPEVDMSHLETKKEANKKLEEVKSYADIHSKRTDNPHKVTKSQVGLGNVSNYGIATKKEAEEGKSNNTYMTPLRVLESLIANSGSIIDEIVVMDEHLPSDAGMDDFPKGVSVGYTSVLGDNYPQRWGTLINFCSKSDLVMAQLWFGNGGGGNTVRHKLYYRIYNRNGTGLVNGWTPWYKIIDDLDKSDSTTSSSSNTVATSNAVKKAYDRADEAFQLGVKQKQATVDSLTSIGASLPSDPTWDRLQSEIKKADYVREAKIEVSKGQSSIKVPFKVLLMSAISDDKKHVLAKKEGFSSYGTIYNTSKEMRDEIYINTIIGNGYTLITFSGYGALPEAPADMTFYIVGVDKT